MTVRRANQILDMARAGVDVPDELITRALIVTGDASSQPQPVHEVDE